MIKMVKKSTKYVVNKLFNLFGILMIIMGILETDIVAILLGGFMYVLIIGEIDD